MSQSEYLFDPRALARVAAHVEWEPELRYYKDGTSNQSHYVKAMTMLWERWMREYGLPELLELVHAGGTSDWLGFISTVLETIKEKLNMFRGFFEGLWYGANPPKLIRLPGGQVIRASIGPSEAWAPEVADSSILSMLAAFFEYVNAISEPLDRPTYQPAKGVKSLG